MNQSGCELSTLTRWQGRVFCNSRNSRKNRLDLTRVDQRPANCRFSMHAHAILFKDHRKDIIPTLSCKRFYGLLGVVVLIVRVADKKPQFADKTVRSRKLAEKRNRGRRALKHSSDEEHLRLDQVEKARLVHQPMS